MSDDTRDAISKFLDAAEDERISDELIDLEVEKTKKDISDENTKRLIDAGMKEIDLMFRVMRDQENPKMYLAAAKMIETLAKINKEYSEDIAVQTGKNSNGGVIKAKNVFINGTATDVLDSINDKPDEKEVK